MYMLLSFWYDDTSRDIAMWSFIISSSRFTPPNATLIMPPAKEKGKKPEKLAEAQEKTIWYLVVDHEGKANFGNLARLVVQANTTVAELGEMIKEKKPNELGGIDSNRLEPWIYKHKDLSQRFSFDKLKEIVGGIKFSETSRNLMHLVPRDKVTDIDFPNDVILLIQVMTTDTATAGGKGSECSYVFLQLNMFDNRAARNWR